MWLPASGKAKVVAIGGTGQADRVIAQAGITSIADLKGKKVAVPEGTSGDMILQLALKSAGLSMSDVEKVAMDPPTVVSAFASKQIDAAGIWYPLIGTLKEQVPDLVELARNSDFKEEMMFPNVMVAGTEVADKKAEALSRILKVFRDAMDWRADNQDKAVELVAKLNAADAAKVAGDAANGEAYKAADLDKLTTDGTIAKWLDAMAEFYKGAGKIEGTPVKAAEFYLGDAFVKAGK